MSDRDDEIEAFQIFMQKLSLIGEYEHHPGNKPGDEGKPDFTVNFNGGLVGIEITEINIPPKTYGPPPPKDELTGRSIRNPVHELYGMPLREHEAAKQRIVDQAHEKAMQSGLPPLRVAVYFAGNLQKGKVEPLTGRLFEIVKSHCLDVGPEVTLKKSGGLPREFWQVHIQSYADGTDLWNYIEVGSVETEFAPHVQEIIDAKSTKIRQYLQHCQVCWLIIVAPGDRPSSFYVPAEQVKTTPYHSAFERVFFMNKAFKTIYEFPVRKEETT